MIEPNAIILKKQTVELDCLKSDISAYNFIQISDLHFTGKTSQKKINNLSEKIKNQNPTAVFITGDLISNNNGIDNIISFINQISKDYSVFITFGNWDYWSLNYDINEFKNKLELSGAKVLINDHIELAINNKILNIIGIKDPYTSNNIDQDLTKALKLIKNNNCNILLAHSPDIIKKASQNNINFILTGHTHGGQIYVPYLTKKIIPSNPDGEGFIKGLYNQNKTQMYVNRGIGTSVLPFRFLNSPEITLINFQN
ncbi:MAG: metallophosphoesterase [Patescibacteria group bacterium]|nr:metallophosphoesterase [Patescibacteria group bacterium]